MSADEQSTTATPRYAPNVGAVVHYLSEGSPVLPDGSQKYRSECRAAIVTDVPEMQIPEQSLASLCVLQPTGIFFRADVEYAEFSPCFRTAGTWHPGSHAIPGPM